MGPMGFGVCAVVGARLGKPERLAVALVGDGAFLMQSGEVSTAAGHDVGAVWVVLVDDDLRMVSQGMEMMFPKDPSYDNDYRLGKPDLAKVAAGLGADVTVVNKPADLSAAWANVMSGAKAGRPQVVLAMIDRNAEPPYWTKPYWQPVAD
jgi:acetolactate synthase-1/2/3 large subunit